MVLAITIKSVAVLNVQKDADAIGNNTGNNCINSLCSIA